MYVCVCVCGRGEAKKRSCVGNALKQGTCFNSLKEAAFVSGGRRVGRDGNLKSDSCSDGV